MDKTEMNLLEDPRGEEIRSWIIKVVGAPQMQVQPFVALIQGFARAAADSVGTDVQLEGLQNLITRNDMGKECILNNLVFDIGIQKARCSLWD